MDANEKKSVKAMHVEDVMTAQVFSVSPTMTLREVGVLFLGKRISGAPVVDQNGIVISVISQSDLIQFMALDGIAKPVNFYLSKLPKFTEVVGVRRTDTFKEVFKKFLTNPVRRIIVTDDTGRLQGLVSKSNLIKAFIESAD
jgi:predicted transcriptional regulator